MILARDQIERLAALASLEVGEEDAGRLGHELARILDFVRELDTAVTDDIEPLTHPLELSQSLRSDCVGEPVDRDRFQRDAPQTEAGYYLVPRVIE